MLLGSHKWKQFSIKRGLLVTFMVQFQDHRLQPSWDDKDMDARAELLLAIEPSIVSLVKDKRLSKEIWDFLGETYDRKGPRQKAEEFRRLINMKMYLNMSWYVYIR